MRCHYHAVPTRLRKRILQQYLVPPLIHMATAIEMTMMPTITTGMKSAILCAFGKRHFKHNFDNYRITRRHPLLRDIPISSAAQGQSEQPHRSKIPMQCCVAGLGAACLSICVAESTTTLKHLGADIPLLLIACII